jgi:hypothetical protein
MRYSVIAMLLACLLPAYAFAQARPAIAPDPAQAGAQSATAESAPPEKAQPEPQRELTPAEYAAAFAATVAQNTELMAGQTGKAYLDESYTDADGKLHIVISQAAAMQFRRDWPRTGTCVNIVAMGNGSPAAKAKTTTTSGGGLAGLGGSTLNLPGLGTLDPTNPDFINQVKQIRALNPEAFDQGFRQGYGESLSKFDPATQELMKQLVPMSGGIGVDEALDKLGGLLEIYNQAPKI